MSKTFVITVSGTCGGAGKTRLVERLIPCLRHCAAIKACAHGGRTVAVVEEDQSHKSPGKDTGRFLSAGAARAYLVTGPAAGVRQAVERIIGGGEFDVVVVESNRLTRELKSDVAFFVKGRGRAKPGAELCEARADAIARAVPGKRRSGNVRQGKAKGRRRTESYAAKPSLLFTAGHPSSGRGKKAYFP